MVRYGRNLTERWMSGRTDYGEQGEDPGLDTIKVFFIPYLKNCMDAVKVSFHPILKDL